jgi:hypothetical protein
VSTDWWWGSQRERIYWGDQDVDDFVFIFARCISRTTVLSIYRSSHYLLHKDILNTVLQH